jgi:hypothetical protein
MLIYTIDDEPKMLRRMERVLKEVEPDAGELPSSDSE